MSSKVYFVYTDDSGQFYYYDNDTQETTYERPTSGELLDPETSNPFVFPGEPRPEGVPQMSPREPLETDTPVAKVISVSIKVPEEDQRSEDNSVEKVHHHHHRRGHASSRSMGESPLDEPRKRKRSSTRGNDLIIDVPRDVRHFKERRKSFASPCPRESFFPDANALALPSDLMSDIHKFKMTEFAKQFFKEHRKGRVFSRKKVSVEEMTQFQDQPIKLPLLKAHSNNKVYCKKAIDSFKLILAFTGADPSAKGGGAPSVMQLFDLMTQSPELRDEVFFQLIKQTRQNPMQECLYKTWQLFLIIATIFPSARNSEIWIKSHLASCSKDTDKKIAELAQFTYIRFSARCAAGKQLDGINRMQLMSIPEQMYSGHAQMNQSIYEQLWHQRSTYPRFPVPFLMHRMAQLILAKNALNTEGIFRIPGNKKLVEKLQDDINEGKDTLDEAGVHDICSLLKSWFASLPETVIGAERFGELQTAFENETIIDFVHTLPKAHFLTLRYLIGFLKHLSKGQAITMMGPSNLARVFAPNVIDSATNDLRLAKNRMQIAEDFMSFLISNWDTSDIYPPAPELLVRAEQQQ